MKKLRFATTTLLILLAAMFLLVSGGCAGTYSGTYTGPGLPPGPGYGGYNPPLVYDTVIDLYLRVLDPAGYAVPGIDVELRVDGMAYYLPSTSSGQFYSIYEEFPGEWANFNQSTQITTHKYVGQPLDFEVVLSRWGFRTMYLDYRIDSLDQDTIYLFFDEVVMYP